MPPSPPTEAQRAPADPARPALVALFAYLLVLLPATLREGRALWALSLAHAMGMVLVMLALHAHRGAGATRWARLLVPLVALPLLYAELGAVIEVLHDGTRDATVLRWERVLFDEPARTLAARLPSLALSEVLHAGYLSYYPLIYLPPLLLAFRGRRHALGETVLALTLAYATCFLVFVAFPVEGPRYRFGAAPGAPAGPFRDLARLLLEGGSSRGTAFPSSHVAVSLAQTLLALRHQRRVGVIAALCTVGVALGALYGGFHYAVDVLAGLVVGAAAALAAGALWRTTQETDRRRP
ncbi:MAG TPA: phosphatase PAP2 family protein [Gemmatimonadaceae bacterium]|nr:phosphatase PAP2 family protein [Gemmatimonadaceae bacterium]